jgi:hypothetical protein
MQFKIMDLKPANAVSIIECDMNVEFDAPDGYVEPSKTRTMVCLWVIFDFYLLFSPKLRKCP